MATVPWKSWIQDQDSLEVMSLRLLLFRGHVFNFRLVKRSCIQDQGCLGIMSSRLGCVENLFSRSGLFRGHVFKVRIV